MNEPLKSYPYARLVLSLLLPGAILVVSMLAWFIVIGTKTPVEHNPNKKFYESTIKPLIDENAQANLDAVKRCLERIDDAFGKYQRGVEPFAEDITSIGTRLGILWRMPADWWYEDGRVQHYVQTKFEEHIFSEKQLNEDLRSALVSLRDELRANRSQLLTSVKLAVSESDFPELAIPDYRSFDEQVNSLLTEFLSERAKDSV